MKLHFFFIPAFVTFIFPACETPNTGNEGGTGGTPPTLNGNAYPTLGEVERLDPALNRLIAPDAKIEQLADGFDWAEGPVWVKYGQFVLFSDIPPNKIYKWSEREGLQEFLHPSGYTGSTPRAGEPGSNGLLIDRFGRLVLCQHGDRRIARLGISIRNPKPIFETLADNFQGKKFNSPNDACYNKNGDLYFTDPPYGLEGQLNDPKKELSFQGVYLLNKAGEVKLLTDKIAYPNGIALSPNEKILYVAESGPNTRIHAFNLQADGTLDQGRMFFDPKPLQRAGKRGGCDGLKVDQRGNLFATGPGGVLVITPQGKHLGTISTGTRIANVGWGDDGRTLYLTADMFLCRIRTLTKGAGF